MIPPDTTPPSQLPPEFFAPNPARLARRSANAGRTRPLPTDGRGHPTTSDIDYSEAEVEFLKAVENWKIRTGRKFPTATEILRIARTLGYEKGIDPIDSGTTMEFDTAAMAAAAQAPEGREGARAATSSRTARPWRNGRKWSG